MVASVEVRLMGQEVVAKRRARAAVARAKEDEKTASAWLFSRDQMEGVWASTRAFAQVRKEWVLVMHAVPLTGK